MVGSGSASSVLLAVRETGNVRMSRATDHTAIGTVLALSPRRAAPATFRGVLQSFSATLAVEIRSVRKCASAGSSGRVPGAALVLIEVNEEASGPSKHRRPRSEGWKDPAGRLPRQQSAAPGRL